MRQKILVAACGIAAVYIFAQESGIGIQVTAYPNPVYIERLENGQGIAADFGIENNTADKLILKSLTVSVFDNSGQLSLRKALNDERKNTVYEPDRVAPPHKTLHMGNPFDLFDKHLVLASL